MDCLPAVVSVQGYTKEEELQIRTQRLHMNVKNTYHNMYFNFNHMESCEIMGILTDPSI